MCLNQEIYLLGVEMHITFGAFRFMINIKGVFLLLFVFCLFLSRVLTILLRKMALALKKIGKSSRESFGRGR